MLLLEKYRPKKLAEFCGNPSAIEQVQRWALEWERGNPQKPLLVCGPTGTGKTALAYTLRDEFNWDLIETNASDLRNADALEHFLSATSLSSSLFGKQKLILIDEADALQAADRGGKGVISEVLKQTKQPILLTATDAYDQKLSGIRALCQRIDFRRVTKSTLANYLQRIAHLEKIDIGEEELTTIAETAAGDIRAGLNDLQARNPASSRDREKDIFKSLQVIFKTMDYAEARKISWEVELDHDLFKLWVDENLPREYTELPDLARAFSILSRADCFDGRIYKRQYWGFWRYSKELLTAGIAFAKDAPYHHFVMYAFPTYLQRMGASKKRRGLDKQIGRKLGVHTHCSAKEAKGYFPIFAAAVDSENIAAFRNQYQLDGEELAYLLDKPEQKIRQMLKFALPEGEKSKRGRKGKGGLEDFEEIIEDEEGGETAKGKKERARKAPKARKETPTKESEGAEAEGKTEETAEGKTEAPKTEGKKEAEEKKEAEGKKETDGESKEAKKETEGKKTPSFPAAPAPKKNSGKLFEFL